MNQDLSAGLGAGLMNLGSMWSQFLMKRMDAEWEDERADKRAQAAARAELEKRKALDEYLAGRPAGMAPAVTEGPDGQKQYMMQPINSIGAPVGELKPMAPHQRTAYDLAETKRRQEEAINLLNLQGKQKDIESKDVRMERDRAQTGLAIRRTEEVGKGKEKEPKGWKSETYAQEQMDKLSADLHPSLVNELESREALLEQSLPTEYDETVYAHALKRIYDEIKRKNDELMRKARMTKAYGDEAEELFKPKIGAPK